MTQATIWMAALGALLTSPAWAQAPSAFTVISPIFGQLVTFSIPASFAAVSENTNGPSYIREAVLKGETARSWTQMITVTGAKGLADNPKVSPETLAGSIVGGFKSACPDSFTAHGFGPAKFGDQDAYVAVAIARGSSPAPTSTARPRSLSRSKALPITTRCNGPSAHQHPPKPRSTRPNGWRGCACCSRSGSARSYPASGRPIRAAPAKNSPRRIPIWAAYRLAGSCRSVDNLLRTAPAAGRAAVVCYRLIGLTNDGQNICVSPSSVPAISA